MIVTISCIFTIIPITFIIPQKFEMKTKLYILGNIYLLISSLFIAQQTMASPAEKAILKGQVTDATTHQPLAGASIYIHEAKTGAISNEKGYFITPYVPEGKYLVEISFQGYQSIIETIEIKNTTEKNVALQLTYAEHENVTVTGVTSAVKTRQSIQPISIVKKADLLKQSANNLMEGLSAIVPGLQVLTTGPAIAKPVIRGLGYNRLVVVNDGVRQEGQQWGDEHGIEIDQFSVQRAEILKGPASLMYGSDAMAGVINLLSNIPVEQGTIKGNVSGSFTDNNRMKTMYAQLSANHKNGFNWNIYSSLKSAGNYKNKLDGYVLNSAMKENNFGGYVGVNKKWGYSHFTVSHFDQRLGIVEGARDVTSGHFLIYPESTLERVATDEELSSNQIFTPNQRVQHLKFTSDNNISIGKNRLNILLGYQQNKRREFGNPTHADEPDLYFKLSTFNYNIQLHTESNQGWKTTYGISGMQQQNENLAEEVIIPAYRQFDFGGFLLTRKTFFDRLTLSGGIRYDWRQLTTDPYEEAGILRFKELKQPFSNWSGSIGLSYEASASVVWKFNIARGFRAPTVAELTSNGAHEGTNRYEYGQSKLQSETSLQLDGGVDINTEHISLGVSLFYNSISNYIFYRKLLGVSGTDSLVDHNGSLISAFTFNQSPAHLYGTEIHFDIHPHPLDWLHFENNFSFVRGKFKDAIDGSNNIPFIPAARWTSELRGNFKSISKGIKNVYAKIVLDQTFAQQDIFSGYETETATPGYALLNAGIGGEVAQKNKTIFSWHIALNNLTDIAYQSHLSRLKYTDTNAANGRTGVFNMGRNIMFRINIPLSGNL